MEQCIKELLALLSTSPCINCYIQSKCCGSEKLYQSVINTTIQSLIADQDVGVSSGLPKNLVKVGLLYDTIYNRLHTGQWQEVQPEEREIFTILSYIRIVHIMLASKEPEVALKDGTYLADLGLMLGARIATAASNDLLTEAATILTTHLSKINSRKLPLKRLKVSEAIDDADTVHSDSDVPVLECPSLDYFRTRCYDCKQPALLRKVIDDWPAVRRWHDLNYLLSVAGERTVPVEIGSQYSNEDWSQRLMKFGEFLQQTLSNDLDESTDPVAYLAQHDLFDQIPALRRDIVVPDYVGRTDTAPRIKAWLGPRGTVSPLHTDPCHNLLCQVFGSKLIILARPEDTESLYPHDHFILNNTSRVDARHLDYERFPLLKQVRFYRLTLRRGEALYIPPKWWHYVESLSPSFSVSFWFE
ncbi:bifunctional peptidase and arginyl-hydroxylase JMJD5 [Anopheles cruzii]|uniref:bifunctional peptidase and arginyl-hydroxylase JMJD5 n=1 Tax=Anopheles cruzii TaxID=68878 RepID=UPI0022EC632C|nr:bifunctional peptidase and arginyl-hydroxylase JMJD5 [Anopheles cruzii]